MIGVLRQYAREKLLEFPEEQVNTKNLFCEYYAEFVGKIESALQSVKAIDIVSEVNMELDNIRTAWSAIVEQENDKLIEKALLGIFYIYDTNGWLREGSDTFQKIIDSLDKGGGTKNQMIAESSLLGKLCARQAMFLYQLGYYDRAKELLDRSLRIARKYENKEEIGVCYNTMGNISYMLSNFDHAREMYNAWLEIAQELNLQKGVVGAYNNLGVISYRLNEYEQAKEFFGKSKQIAKAIGYEKGVAFADTNIALVLHAMGNNQEAKKIFIETLAFDQRLGDKISTANTLNNLGLVHKSLEEYDAARKVFEESLAIRQEIGDRMGTVISLINLGDLDYIHGRYDEALARFLEWNKISKELNDNYSEAGACVNIARTYFMLGNYELAKKYYLDALNWMKKHHYFDYLHDILYGFASLLSQTDNKELALELVCFVIANEKMDKRLLDWAEELRNNLIKDVTESDRIVAQKNAKAAKQAKYIKMLSTIFDKKTARKNRSKRENKC